MQAKSFKEEMRDRMAKLALILAEGGQWNAEQRKEAVEVGEIKQSLAEIEGKPRVAERLEDQITTIRKKV